MMTAVGDSEPVLGPSGMAAPRQTGRTFRRWNRPFVTENG
jgi:hypothetical protein